MEGNFAQGSNCCSEWALIQKNWNIWDKKKQDSSFFSEIVTDQQKIRASCAELKQQHGIIVNVSWGTASDAVKMSWKSLGCDSVISP